MCRTNLTKLAVLTLACCVIGAPTRGTPEQNIPSYPTVNREVNEEPSIASLATRAQNTLYPRAPAHGAPYANGTQTVGNGTAPSTASATGLSTTTATASTADPLRLSFVNNLDSDDGYAYVSALDVNGKVVMLTPSGNFYYPQDPGSETPRAITGDVAIKLPARGHSLKIAIPGYVEGARIWFAQGKLDFATVSSPNGPALVEPTAINPDDASAKLNWGFVELTYIAGYGLFANLSFVDFVGMALGMRLQTDSTRPQLVKGIPNDAAQQVCNKLKQHRGTNRKSWGDLCVPGSNGEVLRVISPSALLSQQPEAFPGYFNKHVDRVWEHYASSRLTIDTQSAAGKVSCTVSGEMLKCDGDDRGFSKPSASDIFGCNTGPFAISQTDNQVHKAVVPRLCAALHRGTLLVKGGQEQPRLKPARYYKAGPSNWYSAFVHEVELDGRGYAFAYDDVAPSVQEDVAGAVAAADPRLLTVFVGGMPS